MCDLVQTNKELTWIKALAHCNSCEKFKRNKYADPLDTYCLILRCHNCSATHMLSFKRNANMFYSICPATTHYGLLCSLKRVKISSSADADLLLADPDTTNLVCKVKQNREQFVLNDRLILVLWACLWVVESVFLFSFFFLIYCDVVSLMYCNNT